MIKTVIIPKKELPDFLPQGWKGAVAERIGVHPKSICRILRNKGSYNYRRIVKAAEELYGVERREY